ncbi:MAG: TolC family protein, partial [Planctomycetaceae bacterium]
MKRRCNTRHLVWVAAILAGIPGCRALFSHPELQREIAQDAYSVRATEIEYPDVEIAVEGAVGATHAPLTISNFIDGSHIGVRQMRLEEVIRMGLRGSRIARKLGGVILRSPASTQTVQDPAIQEANPRTGVESVLSAYDATLTSSLVSEKNDRALNNFFTSGGTNILDQDLSVLQTQISKRSMTGTEFTVRNNTDYDANNAGANQLPSAWNTDVEAEVRHPLLQGSGVEYNRLGGPSDIPGVANGVLIARVNTDLSLADFEAGIRDFVSDIENAYWDLYYAYRDLDSKLTARDAALKTWRRVLSLKNRRGGEAVRLAQAREQYFRLQEEVQNALSGRLLEGTHTNNGSSGGTFRATAGVQVAERRLRYLIGMPINDGQLLRPADHPIAQKLNIVWESAVADALSRRVELRRQRWLVKRREMELAASRNFLMPRFDAVGRYR